jgi:RNA polymerase sigma-70 factor (ECF subfamily)
VIDDLVQETLLAAVTGLHAFDGRSLLRTWVVSILSRKIVDHYRRSERWAAKETLLDDPDLVCPTSRPSPERELSDRQALGILEKALGDLPAQERLAIVLSDIEEMDREEVCNVLAVTATHLRVILHRGRNRLRRALEIAGV